MFSGVDRQMLSPLNMNCLDLNISITMAANNTRDKIINQQ